MCARWGIMWPCALTSCMSGLLTPLYLSRLFSHGDGPLAGLVDLEQLKQKERDGMEEVMQFWKSKAAFDMQKLRLVQIRAAAAEFVCRCVSQSCAPDRVMVCVSSQ